MTRSRKRLKHRDIFEQRDHPENDHDDAHDLLGAPVERQQIDQIKDQDNDQKSNEYTYKHEIPPETPVKKSGLPPNAPTSTPFPAGNLPYANAQETARRGFPQAITAGPLSKNLPFFA
jgi:hypothetical protein